MSSGKDVQLNLIPIPLPSTAAHNLLLLSNDRSDNVACNMKSEACHSQLSAAAEQTIPPANSRHTKLHESISTLQSQIAATKDQLKQNLEKIRQSDSALELEDDEKTLHAAQQIVSRHIKLLHRYNEIKDIGLGLMGLIADKEGKRLGDVMKEREMNDKD